ncbi:MmgE/PrpD family protein [Paracoccus sp. (in: a-proteobacteria)]|uniref:MmgE/PrpD family protein n=1 Tax=Paracoccus sp. TaxID=267 RepID=UPI002B000D7C|nr:MmgE/PrpD family protein [Paracoccus sp. (in: a-proteobacteria)]
MSHPASPPPEDLSFAYQLADKIIAAQTAPIPRGAIEVAKSCILDTVGVTLAAVEEPCVKILRETKGLADGAGEAPLLGTAERRSALDAALINGAASHALDFDDFTGVMGGHHSVAVLPAMFSALGGRTVTGKAFLQAYAVGVEVAIRMARGVNYHHYDKGWHPTTTLGIFGGVASVATLLGLTRDQLATALGIAASLSAGLKVNFGTMTKPLHVGHANRSALFACLAAEAGFTASAVAFEGKQGFFDVFNGPGTYDAAKILADWFEPWEIAHPDLGLKQFACCGSTHAAITMALKLRKAHAIDPATIEILPHGRRLRHTNKPFPQTPLEAKFSVQYGVARALLDGVVPLGAFEGDAHLQPEIRSLLDRTEARPHPDMADDAAQQWGAEVIVTLTDGTVLGERIEQLVGRGGNYPMSETELWQKFEDCAKRALPREQIAPLFERLLTLESAKDMAQVLRLSLVSDLQKPQIRPDQVQFVAATGEDAPETTWVP